MDNDLISRSKLLQAGNAREMTTAITAWNELDVKTKVAVLLYAKAFKSLVKEAPAVDAVPVVRCKDCKNLYDEPDDYCCIRHVGLVKITPDSYCSYGERRSE